MAIIVRLTGAGSDGRAEWLDEVLDDELPRCAQALERLAAA
jgi:hypothetical protein